MRTRRLLCLTLMPALVLAAILVPFLILDDRLETATTAFLAGAGDMTVALAAVALLAGDVLLPVPSSLVSLAAAGALGMGLGALTIWTGMTLGCLIGWATGRGLLAPLDRAIEGRTDAAPSRWGVWVLILCRPVPVLAEMSVLVAAARGMRLDVLMLACSLANLPVAVAYGWFGAAYLGEVPMPWLLAAVAVLCALGLALRAPCRCGALRCQVWVAASASAFSFARLHRTATPSRWIAPRAISSCRALFTRGRVAPSAAARSVWFSPRSMRTSGGGVAPWVCRITIRMNRTNRPCRS